MNPIAYLTLNKIDYPILKVKEGYVVIDEKPSFGMCFHIQMNEFIEVSKEEERLLKDHIYLKKIIASTFPLEGVKRFEMPKDDNIEKIKKLILFLLPPESFGEDGNAEELWNRVEDIESC